jgi:flagellar capping protein FliD
MVPDISGVSFNPANATNQTAADAKVKVDGITYVRTSNALTDVDAGFDP